MIALPVLSWPKVRTVRDTDGTVWAATIEPGRLSLATTDPAWLGPPITIANADDLRALSLALYAAAIERDQMEETPPGGRAHLKRQRRRAAKMAGGR